MMSLPRSLFKKVRRLEKSTPPPVVAVVTNMRCDPESNGGYATPPLLGWLSSPHWTRRWLSKQKVQSASRFRGTSLRPQIAPLVKCWPLFLAVQHSHALHYKMERKIGFKAISCVTHLWRKPPSSFQLPVLTIIHGNMFSYQLWQRSLMRPWEISMGFSPSSLVWSVWMKASGKSGQPKAL